MLKITVLRSPSVELNGVPLSFPFKRCCGRITMNPTA